MKQADLRSLSSPEGLLRTKLILPQNRADLVPRSRLLQRLNESVEQSRLTLVSASAGFGKTTLLSFWAKASKINHPTAWVSLDEGDNVPARFWMYVINALGTLVPTCEEEPLALLSLPQPPAVESILIVLMNALTTLQQTIVVILDDFHTMTNPAIQEEFAFFLDHLPPRLHVMLAAREDPPLPLHLWRAQGLLTELHIDDLRFTEDEVTAFFQQTMRLDLAAEDIAMLEARTEGWIAGLQLAALSLRGHQEAGDFIATFTGTHRFVLDYLAREIFSRQMGDIQEFLLCTSISDRLTAPLCNALTGRDDGQVMLEQLERANLFLIPLDHERHWYRYHHLFAEFLRERLHHTFADLLPSLHQRASIWYEAHDLLSEAISHALLAGDLLRAADLIEQGAGKMWAWNRTNELTSFLEVLPDELVLLRPHLCIYRAWMFSFTTQTTEVEKWLREGERQLQAQNQHAERSAAQERQMLGEIFVIRTLVATKQRDMASALACSEQAKELLETASPLFGTFKYTTAYALSSLGDDAAACRCLEEGITASKASGNDLYVAHCYVFLACLQMSCGQMHQAAATCQQALKYGSTSPTGRLLLTGAAFFSLYELHYEWNNLEDAQYYLEKAIEHAKQAGDVGLERVSLLAKPNLLLALGQRERACHLFDEEYQHICPDAHDRVAVIARESRVKFWLEAGDTAAAGRWAREYLFEVENEYDPLYVVERMAIAGVYHAQGRLDETLNLLEKLLPVSKRAGRTYSVLGLLSLQALTLYAHRETQRAFETIEEALALGEPEDQIRVFADFGRPMAELLLSLRKKRQYNKNDQTPPYSQEYLVKLLLALHVPITSLTVQPRSTPVSTREREVLRLVAEGLSTKEVARQLAISESTAKTHIKRIYAKLVVKSRTQAIAQARAQGWL